MDLDQQLGSLFILGFAGDKLHPDTPIVRDLESRHLGGVILFDHCLHNPDLPGNIVSPGQLKELTDRLKNCSEEELFICVDQEGGLVQRLNPRNGFPASLSAAELGDDPGDITLVERFADQTAASLSSAGININFAPVVDVNTNEANPVIGNLGRSFSENPAVVSAMAAGWIRAHERHHVISCPKHFPGHGSSTTDSHHGFVDISATWHKEELLPYRTLLEGEQIDMVMAGHLFHRELDPIYPATMSHSIITGLLRQKLGYGGLVVSDDMQMKAISDRYQFSEAVCRSFGAGIDMLVIGNNLSYDPNILAAAISALQDGLKRGLVTKEQLHAACERVRTLKTRMRQNKNG